MRVAVVCPYDLAAPGGVQDQVMGLVDRLRIAGHEAWAVAPGEGGPDGTRHVGPTQSIPANRSNAPISLSPRTAGRARAAVADAEVIHVHEPLMPAVSLGLLRRGMPPMVGTFHADPGPVVRGLYRAAGPLLRRRAARLTVATAVSETARSAVAGLVDARIVPNAVDVAAFEATSGARVPGRVAFIGRDEPRKGLDVLLTAWPAIRSAHPDANLHVIGAVRDGAPGGVEFLGRVTEEAKRRQLAEATVFAAPNLGGESFGIVLIEAMAAGAAVVASGLDAFRAVAGGAAVFVPPGDAVALGAAIGELLADGARTAAASEAGAALVRQYDWDRVAAAYLDAYRDALDAAS